MKIGIMGGTFDPIHNGHLMLGQAAYEAFGLDRVWYMPNGNPPHKETSINGTAIKDRAEMVRLAIAPHRNFRLEMYEANRRDVSTLTVQWNISKGSIRRMNSILS